MTEETQQTLIMGDENEAKMIGGSSGPQKPVFDKMTKARIADVTWGKEEGLKKDKKGNEYKPCSLIVSFQVEGHKDPIKEYYAFGVYQNKNAAGETKFNAFYGTEKSKGGALRRLTERTFNMPAATPLNDYIALLKGKDCVIKSEDTTYQNQAYKKIVVQQFQL